MVKSQIYRIYCFDGVESVWAADWIEAADDRSAVEAAKRMDHALKKEVWRGAVLVGSLTMAGAAYREVFHGDDFSPRIAAS